VKECSGDIAWWCPYIEATDCYDAAATCCRTCQKYRKSVPGKTDMILQFITLHSATSLLVIECSAHEKTVGE